MSAADPPRGDIAARLARVRERIAAAAARVGRDPAQVTLVGVSKGQPARHVADAVLAGLGHVGESFAQEAKGKIPGVRALLEGSGAPPPRWHFVGRLQRNKARVVAELCDCIESVDRLALASELDRRASGLGRSLDVLLQVNLSGESQKGGVAPGELSELLAGCRALPALRVRGLMGVPAAGEDPESARPSFVQLRELRDAQEEPASLPELSMGMSGDFEVAVEEGATWVRVGTALFGARES